VASYFEKGIESRTVKLEGNFVERLNGHQSFGKEYAVRSYMQFTGYMI
jgi:hypothetical protein